MTAPTVDDLRTWSNVAFARAGFGDDDKLQVVIDRAVGYLSFISGRTLDTMPSEFIALAQEAIQKRVEQVIYQSQDDYVESAAQNEVIQSFSAGLYSESRRDPNTKRARINTWPALDELLWMLMTPEKYDYWLALLTGAPYADFSVVEVAWGSGSGATGLSWFEPWDRYVYEAVSM